MARYIDPKTGFGFKRLFAQEDSKDILSHCSFDVYTRNGDQAPR